MKKAAIIFGSPRKNSNTGILVGEARKGLSAAGMASEIFYLNEMNIKGCQACNHCKKEDTTICVIKDDMRRIHEAMETCDGLIVASPIFFADITAQTKIWLDRMYPYIDSRLRHKLPQGKKAALIFTQNQPDAGFFASAMKTFRTVIKLFGYEVKDSLLACNMDRDNKPMVTENKDLMQNAYNLGKNLLA